MSRALRPALRALLLIAPLLATAACNTIEGAGQDIKATGTWIEKKAGANK